jgi:hypothetical protein
MECSRLKKKPSNGLTSCLTQLSKPSIHQLIQGDDKVNEATMTYEWMRLILLDYIEILTKGEVSEIQTVVNSALTDARLLLNRIEQTLDSFVNKEIAAHE